MKLNIIIEVKDSGERYACSRKQIDPFKLVVVQSGVRWPKSVTAISICSRQFQFAHGSFNLLTVVSICSRQFQFRLRQFQFAYGSFNFAHDSFNFAHDEVTVDFS